MRANPVLDVGGTHVTAALVYVTTWSSVPGSRHRRSLRSDGSADEIIDTLVDCASALGSLDGATLTVAMPGPFDYQAGIGRYEGVAKFDALNGVDVRDRLLRALPEPPEAIEFLNDAGAFGIGEWISGATKGCRRSVGITLGTGVGSAFIDQGVRVDSGPLVPPDGELHFVDVDGRPLEDVMSRRAIITAYCRYAGGDRSDDLDVRDIADRAANGDQAALRAIQEPCHALGTALAPWLVRFEAEGVVVGGGMTASWSLIEPPLRQGLASTTPALADLRVERSADPEESVEVGAAWFSAGAS
ncbi:MAG: ROK family protein [Acidothermaceae bacterium]